MRFPGLLLCRTKHQNFVLTSATEDHVLRWFYSQNYSVRWRKWPQSGEEVTSWAPADIKKQKSDLQQAGQLWVGRTELGREPQGVSFTHSNRLQLQGTLQILACSVFLISRCEYLRDYHSFWCTSYDAAHQIFSIA